MILLRPLCWLVGHLWEYQDYASSPDPAAHWYAHWYCDRCGLRKYTKPKGY